MNTNFYRGYIKLKEDKSPISRRMSRRLPNDWPTVGGIFASDYMMIDIDNYEDADLFMQLVDKYQWKTHIVATDSGIHSIFKKPDIVISSTNGCELMCGIICDIKQGRRDWSNSDYECIIKHGLAREVICECNDPQVLPWQLMPFSVKMDLKSVGEGDGRHGIHRQLISRACAYTTNAKMIIDYVQWVNDNIFDVPRKSVNWTVKQVQDWIDANVKDLTIEELLQQYDVKDLKKVQQFIRANYDMKEV